MTTKIANCALLADRHHGLAEGFRGLLESLFHTGGRGAPVMQERSQSWPCWTRSRKGTTAQPVA